MDIIALLVAFALVGCNAFFVATEFAIVKVRPTRIEELIRKQRSGALTVRRIVGNIDGYLSATQLGITLTSLALGWVGEPAFARLLGAPLRMLGVTDPVWSHNIALASAFTTISCLHIVVGELAPKSLAIRRSESVALLVAVPMQVFYTLCFPIIWVLGGVSNRLLSAVGLAGSVHDNHHSEEEIKIILSQARSGGLLSAARSELLRKVLTLPAKTARHLMVPRNEVVLLDINQSLDDSINRAMASGHTRFPLCDRELDDVIGVVDIREVLHQRLQGPVDLRSFAMAAPYFPELMSAERLLAELRQRRATMAVVVDEYGGASGIVTPADVVSAVMGDLAEEGEVVPLPGGAYDVDGVAPLEEIEDALKITFNADNMRTVAGFLMERLGRMPRVGDRVVAAGHAFNIMEVHGPRVRRVRIQRDTPQTGARPANAGGASAAAAPAAGTPAAAAPAAAAAREPEPKL